MKGKMRFQFGTQMLAVLLVACEFEHATPVSEGADATSAVVVSEADSIAIAAK